MPREIKFRAWNEVAKAMYPLEHFGIDMLGNTLQLMPECDHYQKPFIVNNGGAMVFMQYTGLKDKNGKEIYEGDVLKDDVGDTIEARFGELPLSKSGDCVCTYPAFYGKNYGQLGRAPVNECVQLADYMEVIGNIYENPELLNK